MKYTAAFDIGTTSVKGILVSRDGAVEQEADVSLHTHYPSDGRVEQHPEDWLDAVARLAQGWWLNGITPEEVAVVTFSGQMQNTIPIDRGGKPVRPAILYSDARAGEQAENMLQRFGDAIRQKTANPFDGTMTLSKIEWLAEQEPEHYARTAHIFISSKDYVIHHLTGACVTDPTTAATTGMMDLEQRMWIPEIFEHTSIQPEILPELTAADEPAGRIHAEGAARTGFCQGTPVLCGAGDAGATTMGAGAVNPGEMYAYLGTTGWIAIPTDRVDRQGSGIFHLAHYPRHLLIAVAPLLNVGNAHRWATRLFSEQTGDSAYEELERRMQRSQPGAGGVQFLPYLNGERCPVQDPNATGSYIGLKADTTRDDMARAVLEGVSYAMRQIMDTLLQDQPYDQLTLIGGGSKSRVWCQLLADICGVRVGVPENADYLPSLGGAAAGFRYLGWVSSYEAFARLLKSGQKRAVYQPNTDLEEVYEEGYRQFLKLYPALRPLFE